MSGDGDWPVELRGVTESLVATLGPNDRWNVAPLGLHAGDPVTATTWGNTRTRRNFRRQGGGYVQFARDPLLFAEAALSVRETDAPVLDAADAWAEVDAERVDAGEDGGTRWEEWALRPVDSAIERTTVPTTNRGYYAVVEATVAASRLGVDAYDADALRDRLAYFEEVVETCGGERERAAIRRVTELSEWKSQNESF
ncbi:DUF447 family protein [Halostella sp. JP-L12]|uniref:DUF447 domain-containing protein n=1 Tax=Halostella TaxID=1843185 RepID=UPI000EF80E54|nr:MULTISPECIES: DUF447 domain-containing protein [Halostella]NHN48570.1 DUF447 family protein [Halostella sp. JP-L12]